MTKKYADKLNAAGKAWDLAYEYPNLPSCTLMLCACTVQLNLYEIIAAYGLSGCDSQMEDLSDAIVELEVPLGALTTAYDLMAGGKQAENLSDAVLGPEAAVGGRSEVVAAMRGALAAVLAQIRTRFHEPKRG